MIRKFISTAMIVLVIVLAGCPGPNDSNDPVDDPVTMLELSAYITAPVEGEQPLSPNIDTTQYTGTVLWARGDGAAMDEIFDSETVYKAIVNLSAKTGFTFNELNADSFIYTGAVVTHGEGSGKTLTITITFPPTDSPLADTVTLLSLDAVITAPVESEEPLNPDINTTQYTGTVVWARGDGAAMDPVFQYNTIYKAVLSISAKTGFTFTGLGANSFTYTGAAVTHDEGSGKTLTVTIIFSAIPGLDPVTFLDLSTLFAAPAEGQVPQSLNFNTSQYSGSIAWTRGDGNLMDSVFKSWTEYKAILSLTAEDTYSFNGLSANSFTYTGATVTHNGGSGKTLTVTVSFPCIFPITGANWYVSGTGSDSNDGLLNSSSLATVNKALSLIRAGYASNAPWPGKGTASVAPASIIVSGTVTADDFETDPLGMVYIDNSTGAYPPLEIKGLLASSPGTISGAGKNKAVIYNNGADLSMREYLTVSGATSLANSRGVEVAGSGSFTMYGGTISNASYGIFTVSTEGTVIDVRGGTVTGHTYQGVSFGGSNNEFFLSGGFIRNNKEHGVRVGSNSSSNNTFEMTGGTIDTNTVQGIEISGSNHTITITNGTIEKNDQGINYGNSSSNCTMTFGGSAIITGNTYTGVGFGSTNQGGSKFIMNGGTIKSNGTFGLYLQGANTSFIKTDGIIYGNTTTGSPNNNPMGAVYVYVSNYANIKSLSGDSPNGVSHSATINADKTDATYTGTGWEE